VYTLWEEYSFVVQGYAILDFMKLALKIAPQRSTQYTKLATALATPELLASPLRSAIDHVERITMAGHDYLLVSFRPEAERLDAHFVRSVLGSLGATSEAFEYFERLGDMEGPFLRPFSTLYTPFIPPEMAEARRYKGKTNELFTKVLLNVAVFAGRYANQYNERLRILDPLAGGGTTLFTALEHGYDAFGIELNRQDIETTIGYTRQFLTGEQIPFKEIDERRKTGRRYQFEIGKKGTRLSKAHADEARYFVLAQGDSKEALVHMREVPGGPHMHAVVADLPYNIQHSSRYVTGETQRFGDVSALLQAVLPAWEKILLPGGTLALAWNATRVERSILVDLVERHTRLQVLNEPPYSDFAHGVDRVVKRRDILVAVAPTE
jgi:hypothetical protein